MMVLANGILWWDGAARVKDEGYSQGERRPGDSVFIDTEEVPFLWASPPFLLSTGR